MGDKGSWAFVVSRRQWSRRSEDAVERAECAEGVCVREWAWWEEAASVKGLGRGE